MSLAYSSIVLSELNHPLPAVHMMPMRVHRSLSLYASSTRACVLGTSGLAAAVGVSEQSACRPWYGHPGGACWYQQAPSLCTCMQDRVAGDPYMRLDAWQGTCILEPDHPASKEQGALLARLRQLHEQGTLQLCMRVRAWQSM